MNPTHVRHIIEASTIWAEWGRWSRSVVVLAKLLERDLQGAWGAAVSSEAT